MDLPEIATFAAALLAVLALIMAIAWVLRRFSGGSQRAGTSALRRRDRRLGVVEAAQVGPRHRLLLVRRDDREHLLLVGGNTELVIETGIPHHNGDESEVNIRSVEPRLHKEPTRDGLYRPSDDFERRSSREHSPLGGSGFSSTFSDRPDETDDRDETRPRFGIGERDGDQDHDDSFTKRDSLTRHDDYDEEDRETYPHADTPSYKFDDRSREHESDSSEFERDRISGGDRHVIDDEEDADRDNNNPFATALSGSARAQEREAPDPAQSRILSRFLKKDGP